MIPPNMYIPLGVIALLGLVVYGISVRGDRRERHTVAHAAAAERDHVDEHERQPERRRQPALPSR